MKVTVTLTKQEAIDALLQFYKHTGTSEIIILDDEPDDGWVSNIGRDFYGHPHSLPGNTEIEVKFRNGATEAGTAIYWHSQWKETEGTRYDIVAYRVLKD